MYGEAVVIDEDVPEGIPVSDLVFDQEGNERSSWKLCNSVTLPRSEVVFFSQVFFVLILIFLSFYKLLFTDLPCEEKPFWVGILSSTVGYILPNPK